MPTKYKPTLCLDFDGVIHSYTSGWKGVDIIPDPPVDGAFEAIEKYCERFKVNIFSSRSHQTCGIEAMKEWFSKHGWPCYDDGKPIDLHFPEHKPAAIVSIDDRAITFDGTFPSASTIFKFRPWNKRSAQTKMSKTFDSWMKIKKKTLRPWQKEAAKSLLTIMHEQRNGQTGKTFLMQNLLEFINEHGNEFGT